MSEEKMYVVKEGKWYYWDFDGLGGFWKSNLSCSVTFSEDEAKQTVKEHGGHVATLIEEPEKVVLSNEQAKIVENAHDEEFPATYISDSANYDEELLINAYVNGYTVEKEKKYNVKVPHTSLYYWKKLDGGLSINDLVANDKFDALKFTLTDIEYYGLQDCEKEEVTDNGD